MQRFHPSRPDSRAQIYSQQDTRLQGNAQDGWADFAAGVVQQKVYFLFPKLVLQFGEQGYFGPHEYLDIALGGGNQ